MQSIQALNAELVERIARLVGDDRMIEPRKGLFLQRISSATEPVYGVSDPAFCVIAQGSKVMLVGDQRLRYDPAHYLLVTAEIPVTGEIIDASPAQPYLSLRLQIEPAFVSSVMVEAHQTAPRNHGAMRALAVSPLDSSLLDAVVRLIRLFDTPADAEFLGPLITREIIYRLLMGEQGHQLRQIAIRTGATHQINQAISRIRHDFAQPLRIEELAHLVGMSVSGFHAHFKAVTAMSPGQFQKQLRLQEARRLLLGEQLDASTTAVRVGYDDAAYFTRDYKRFFGAPPMRDIARLRTSITATPIADLNV